MTTLLLALLTAAVELSTKEAYLLSLLLYFLLQRLDFGLELAEGFPELVPRGVARLELVNSLVITPLDEVHKREPFFRCSLQLGLQVLNAGKSKTVGSLQRQMRRRHIIMRRQTTGQGG